MLHSLIHLLQTFTLWLVDTLGHFGIFLGMTIESVCIPLPSEVIMLFGGFMAEAGKLNLALVVIAGTLGNLFGSLLAYYVGKYGGKAFILKYGKFIFLNASHLEKSALWFEHYGAATVFFGRLLPVIRTFISLPAGIGKMNIYKFVIYTTLGCIPWNLMLTWLGYSLGSHWGTVEKYMRPISYLMLIAVILLVLYGLYKLWKKRRPAA